MGARPLLAAAVTLALWAAPGQAARIVLINTDGPNEGFNDPTPVAGVQGNSARTLGAQRLRVFAAVAFRLGTMIASDVEILVEGGWEPLDCERLSGTLASAGPSFVFRDFPNAPKSGTWYAAALANAIAGEDLNGGATMSFTFNSDVGSGSCLVGRPWDYRIGVSGTNGFSMEDVLFHELGHGINFLTFVDPENGERFRGFNDAYMLHLADHATGKRWTNMTNAERAQSATRDGDLHWLGGNALAHASRLGGGVDPASGHPQMYAPNPLEAGSSVSHWDTPFDNNADDFMEPFASANAIDLLSSHLFQDLGWSVNRSGADWVEDQNGNGAVEIVLLQVTDEPGGHQVVLMDSRGRKVIRTIELPADWSALDVAVVSHFAGPPASEIAVLQARAKGNKVRVTLFDASTGEEVKRFNIPSGFALRFLSVADFGRTAADELAVLGIRPTTGARVWIRDAQIGRNVKTLSFPRAERPVDMAVLPSFAGSVAPEFATLLRIPQQGRAEITVRDGQSGAVLNRIPLPDDQVPQFLGALADFGGEVGSGELVVSSLGRTSGLPRLTVYDGATGEELARRDFDDPLVPVALEVLPSFGGTMADEVVLWTLLPGNLKPRGFILDGDSLSSLGAPTLDAKFIPHALAALPNVGKTGAADIVVVASSSRDRKVRSFLIDGRGGRIRTLTLP